MKRLLFALLLIAAPASAQSLYAIYASGDYEAAIRAGVAANSAEGFAIAARAALAESAQKPCLSCLKRAEDFARKAIAADSKQADGHVWLATCLGLEGRIIGMIRARLADSPTEAKTNLDAALADDARNPYALAALGGWNIEIVRAGGAFLAHTLYGAREDEGLALFDRAIATAPGNVAVRYQIALSLSGYAPERFHARIVSELGAAIHDEPQTAYEKFIQARAAELLSLVDKPDAFAAKVRAFQGYPD
jgi:hypothetical protein